jgi:6,7-dimethyl-8-ribityllumazine synthase
MSESFQPKEIRGNLDAAGLRFGLVVSRFNGFITERLLAGATEALEQGGASAEQTEIVRVPGSFEIPLAAKKMALAGGYDAIIAIGCVLRGETAHFDYVASEVARGVQLAQMDTGVPIIFCVLTCDTLEQAIERAGLKGGNKGREAGLAALEMAQLSRRLRGPAASPFASGLQAQPAPVAPRARKRR